MIPGAPLSATSSDGMPRVCGDDPCRTTIAGSLYRPGKEKVGTRAARSDVGKTVYVLADMMYKDWKAIYVDKC